MSTTEDTQRFATALVQYVDPDQLARDVEIDAANLTANMQTHASMYVHYAMQTVRARRQKDRYERALEIVEATLEAQYRQTLRDEYEALIAADPKGKAKAPTEAQIRAAVVTDPKYKTASSMVIEAAQIHKMAEVAERGFDARKDMLLQIARDAAREAEGQLRVMANQDAKSARDRLLSTMKGSIAAPAAAEA